MKRAVEYNSQGIKVRGVLATPDKGEGPFPVVVMGGGWCYVKEIVLPHYAQAMLDVGVACLMIDYRNMGESDSPQPQHIDPWGQIDDLKNGITFAADQPELDAERIGVWGISYAGGHAIIVGATDPRVKCVISTVPVVEGWETMRRCHGERRFAQLQKLVLDDRIRRGRGEPGALMAMSSLNPNEELSVWPFPHVNEIFNKIKATEAPRHRHENTVESLENLLQYNVFPYAKRILNTPTLVVIAAGDNITQWDLELEMFNSIPANDKKVVVLAEVNHMSLYNNRSHLDVASQAHGEFVKRHLVDLKA
ncbi:alpha/beta hydrolase [Variovorax sp. GB1P17]|uniref:alpha/beta hydrolase n=1 Tax=Variovorax sp. GB1P17 TaxID=3443740 RepID=UPI003F45B53C